MPLPADYHTHTELCGHAVGRPIDYVRAGQDAGLVEIGISDHFPIPHLPDNLPKGEYAMDQTELPNYIQGVEEAREAFPSMMVRLGFEVDYYPKGMDQLMDSLNAFEADYLLVSVHAMDDWCIDDERMIHRYDGMDLQRFCDRYVEHLIDAVSMHAFDILGHMDLFKKFGHRSKIAPSLLQELAHCIQEADMTVEINTAGLRKPCHETYPSLDLISWLQGKKIPVCFGSDAHHPLEVGWRFQEVCSALQDLGFTHWRQFERRHSNLVPL